ncbi:MAG: NADH-quinone oxidoreductase subunit NuoH [Paracoccaceae bacterium]
MSLVGVSVASGALIGALMLVAAIFTWVERRLLGFFQERLGPNRAGPAGTLQWFADLVKILTKEDAPPPGADRRIYVLAPAVAVAPVLAGFGVVAVAPGAAVVPLDVGVIFAVGMLALTVYAVVLGGWASSNRYASLGALRAAAQVLAYEAFLGLSLMGPVMLAGSFELSAIVEAQAEAWFVLYQPLGAALFAIAGIAAAHRLPFDLPEAENDLVAGYATEYAGLGFGLFFLGEYLAVLLVSALATALFFGGWHGPWLPGPVWFGLKSGLLALGFVLLRAALPRPRYDQLIRFAWIVALPLALVNLLATGAWIVLSETPSGTP